jgi:hypothetical protein
LLTIAIALVIFVIVASPVSALPTKSPLPSANPWNYVWGLFQNLQTQIDSLVTKDTNLQTQITGLDTRMTAVEAKAPTIVPATSALDSAESKSQTALCPDGQKVLGGGGAISQFQPGDKIFIRSSYPYNDDGWIVVAEEATPTDHDWLIETFAICA